MIQDELLAALTADFTTGPIAYRRNHVSGNKELIAKAVGIKSGRRPVIYDLTGGLGKDAFVLAALGCPVIMIERHPVVHVALSQALQHARQYAFEHDEKLAGILQQITVIHADSIEWLRHQALDASAVIYLDPMFPERKKSAAVKKEMVLLQQLVGDDGDAGQLFEAALAARVSRVVVKRPKLAPSFGKQEAPVVYKGSSCRFDVYPLANRVV